MKFISHAKLWFRARQYQRKHDQGGIAFLQSVVKPGDCVCDIGAHKGGYLYWMVKQVGSGGSVHAFEPQLSLYHYLEQLKVQLAWNQVHLNHIALSDAQGEVPLFVPENKKGGAHSSPGATLLGHNVSDQAHSRQMVRTMTLDAYCSDHNLHPSFLKIDVEGNELKVFKGGAGVIQSCKPKILVEIEARHAGQEGMNRTFDLLDRWGYDGAFFRGAEMLPLSQFDVKMHQTLEKDAVYCNNFVFQ